MHLCLWRKKWCACACLQQLVFSLRTASVALHSLCVTKKSFNASTAHYCVFCNLLPSTFSFCLFGYYLTGLQCSAGKGTTFDSSHSFPSQLFRKWGLILATLPSSVQTILNNLFILSHLGCYNYLYTSFAHIPTTLSASARISTCLRSFRVGFLQHLTSSWLKRSDSWGIFIKFLD